MKKLFKMYKSYMIRPIIYKAFTKTIIAFVAALLWDRWVNVEEFWSIDYSFTIIGVVMIAMSWFNYLSFDGINMKSMLPSREEKKESKHRSKDMVDFVDEKVISFDELEEDEKIACNLSSNIITGVIFATAAFISVVL